MYRVKAEAVSGTKVFAGGKWLKCIGNKKVSIGEYIWTDGRCVYGNYQESQQPPIIITPQKDEAVPIMIITEDQINYYTFSKNGLREGTAQNDITKEQCRLMINTTKRNIYIEASKDVLAENIDKHGNVYRMVKLFDNALLVAVGVFKNNKLVGTKNLRLFESDTLNAAPFPEEYFYVANQEFVTTSEIVWAFIENDTDWAFILHTTASEVTTYTKEAFWRKDGSYTTALFQRIHYVTSNVTNLIWSGLLLTLPSFDNPAEDRVHSATRQIYNDLFSIKFPLSKGRYYKCEKFFDEEITNLARMAIYSSGGKKLFTTDCYIFSYLTLTKFNSLFLFASSPSPYSSYVQEGHGVYLFKNGNLEKLISGICVNQRLLPMTKYKNWQNRIQELTIE